MACLLNPYLGFGANARQALEFYRDVFGGTLNISTFGEFGDAPAEGADLVMHGQLETPDGFTLMASDTPPGMNINREAVFRSVSAATTPTGCAGGGTSSAKAAPSRCRWRSRCGATSSACARTASASRGWSISPGRGDSVARRVPANLQITCPPLHSIRS